MTTNLRGIGSSGLAVVLGAALAWSCASGGTDDTGDVGGVFDGGPTLDAPILDDGQTPPPNGDDDTSTTGDDSGGTPPGDDDSGGTQGDDSGGTGDDSGSTGDDGGQTIVDAGHDSGSVDSGCGSVAVVINEVQTAGSGGAGDEWVELFNPSSCQVDLTGWTLKYLSTTGTSASKYWTATAGTKLAAQGYGIIVGSSYSGSTTASIGSLTSGLSDTGGGVGVYDGSSTLLDSVGYGSGATNAFVETSPASAPASAKSIARMPNGTDTNVNSSNFAVDSTPSPGAKN